MHDILGNICAIVGAQWGDEGKGKLVDILSEHFDLICRSAGGANAGHTICVDGKQYIFHLIPSGLLHEGKIGIIGNGCVVHLPTMMEEIEELQRAGFDPMGRIFLSDRAHLIFDYHQKIDCIQEERKGEKCVGTTKRGIGPAYTDKASRNGIRAGELTNGFDHFAERFRTNVEKHQEVYGFEEDVEKEIERYREYANQLQGMITNTTELIRDSRRDGKTILVEGAQGTLLDLDFGTYPYVTSSNTTIAGACSGTGIAPSKIESVIGIVKAYTTRVGGGPFPSEEEGEIEQKLRDIGAEFGATTGRPRRCGWFDVPVARHSVLVNGIDYWNLTKLDVLSEFHEIKIVTGYKYNGEMLRSFPSNLTILESVECEMISMPGWNTDISECKTYDDLPENAKKYVEKLEELTDVPVKYIGIGVEREALIMR